MLLQEEKTLIYNTEKEALNKLRELETQGFAIVNSYKDFSFVFDKWIYVVVARNVFSE